MEAASAGDRDAFKLLYLEHVSAVFGFLASRTDRQQAEDLAAETFARAYGAIGRYQNRDVPFRAWLFRIASNLVIGKVRRKDSTEVALESAHTVHIQDQGVGVEGNVELLLEAEILRNCMDRLSSGHAEVLDLRYLRELSVPETATVLGLSEEAVRALTYRALRALRAEFMKEKGLMSDNPGFD